MARILVIDDVADIRSMLRDALERAGHQVAEAASVDEALRLLEVHPIDVVIADMIMPEKDGLDAIIAIRRKSPDAKIIAISGGHLIGPEGYLDAARKLGASRTFSKPIGMKEMLHAVRDLARCP